MAAIGKRSVRVKVVEWTGAAGCPRSFEARLNDALQDLRERGRSVVYIDYQQSMATTGDAIVRTALVVYEEAA